MRKKKVDESPEIILNELGSKTNLLAVKVPKIMLDILEKEAKRQDREKPDIVRDMLLFHIMPGVLEGHIQGLHVEHKPEDDLQIGKMFDTFEFYLSKVLLDCRHIRKIEERALRMQKKVEKLSKDYMATLQTSIGDFKKEVGAKGVKRHG
jgi:hypothetical protein